MTDQNVVNYKLALQQLAQERGCSLRTAARILRLEALKPMLQQKQAAQVAAHVDWGNRTDIAPAIREVAEVIERRGTRAVSSADRNRVIANLPQSLQVCRD